MHDGLANATAVVGFVGISTLRGLLMCRLVRLGDRPAFSVFAYALARATR